MKVAGLANRFELSKTKSEGNEATSAYWVGDIEISAATRCKRIAKSFGRPA